MKSWAERHGSTFAILSIALATAIFYPGRDYFAKAQWALLYLLVVVLVASLSGVVPAVVAGVLAFFTWNLFFLPPYHTFWVNDPKDWISLTVFLVVAVAMGLQTGRMKWRESEALSGERETALLNRFSSYLVTEMNTAGMTEVLLGEIASAMGAESASLYLSDDDGNFYCAGRSNSNDAAVDDLALWVFQHSTAIGLPYEGSMKEALKSWPNSVPHKTISPGSSRKDVLLPLQTASRVEGVLYVGAKTNGLDYDLSETRLLISIVNQAAAFRERRRLQHIANKAEALEEADRLKSALVSSVSHELKTPLASVTATVTGLLEEDVELDPATVRQELSAISHDLSRLNDSINALFDLARLEADAWSPQREWYEVGEIVGSAVSRLPQKQRTRVTFSLPEDLPHVKVDFRQWARVIQNLLENALAYSPAEEPVCIGGSADENEVRIWVEDRGPGIDDEEKPRVFEKFYRGRAHEMVPSGTGLGLAVAKEIVRAHDGRIWVEDAGPHGARFVVSLPVEEVSKG